MFMSNQYTMPQQLFTMPQQLFMNQLQMLHFPPFAMNPFWGMPPTQTNNTDKTSEGTSGPQGPQGPPGPGVA